MLRQTSLSTLGLSVGSILTLVGLIAYITDNATLNLAGFFYGLPLVLGGLALKTSELKPIPFSSPTSPDVLALREKQATVTQNKLRKDVTRYIYGQDVHLEPALKTLELGRTDDELPVLISIQETAIESAYALRLEFESPEVSLEEWEKKQEKMEKYFGPGVQIKVTQPEEDKIDLMLVTSPKE